METGRIRTVCVAVVQLGVDERFRELNSSVGGVKRLWHVHVEVLVVVASRQRQIDASAAADIRLACYSFAGFRR